MLESSRVVRNCMFTEFASVTHNNFSHFQYLSILACSRSVFLLFSFQSAILATPSLENSNEFSQSILNSKYCLILFEPPMGWLCESAHSDPIRESARFSKCSVIFMVGLSGLEPLFAYILIWFESTWTLPFISFLVGLSGLEPPTSRLSGVRSNQLSYKPIAGL